MDAVPGWGHCPSRGPGARRGPVDREPRPRRTCDLASEGSHRRRRMAVLARAPELLPRSPPPARPAPATGCEGSALTLVSRAQLPVLRNGVASGRCGHLRMRLLLSFHFFLCLSSPAGDGLQRPLHKVLPSSSFHPFSSSLNYSPKSFPIISLYACKGQTLLQSTHSCSF